MKILKIENTIKYELADPIVRALQRSHNLGCFEETETGELILKGKNLKEKGKSIFKIVLLYLQKITGTMGNLTPEERVDFQQQVISKAIGMQNYLNRLNIDSDDFDSYWELINVLDAVMNYIDKHDIVHPHLMG